MGEFDVHKHRVKIDLSDYDEDKVVVDLGSQTG